MKSTFRSNNRSLSTDPRSDTTPTYGESVAGRAAISCSLWSVQIEHTGALPLGD
jgi:hypothetical protein